ncbi:hypothetical protein EKK58_11420 [Candidatus Dependentiae bacterium]|nr:MAG: hypothetical protein EKK58_11420 [Candidatus Dependentiae bacterium]
MGAIKKRIIRFIKPHPGQQEILKLLAEPEVNYVCVNAGRRFGKTLLALSWMIKCLLDKPGKQGLIMSKSSKQVSKIFNTCLKLFKPYNIFKTIHRTFRVIEFNNGSVLNFYMSSNHDDVRSSEFDYIVLDEFALYPDDAWTNSIQPTLANMRDFKVLIVSTPRGKGQWYQLFNRGLDPNVKHWKSFTAPTSANPTIPKKFLEDTQLEVPNQVFRQEYLAEFIENGGEVFIIKNENIIPELVKFDKTSKGYIGIDIGMKKDFTVIFGFNENFEMFLYERFYGNTPLECSKKIFNTLKKFDINQIFVDIETNKNDSVFFEVKNLYAADKININSRIIPTNINKSTKPANIEQLSMLLESLKLKVIDDKYLLSEFNSFSYYYNIHNNLIYGASGVAHDDIVMAACGAVRAYNYKNTKRIAVFSN